MMPVMGNLSYINYAVTCCVGGLMAIHSGDLGGLAAFLQYTRQVSQPINQISQQVNTILSAPNEFIYRNLSHLRNFLLLKPPNKTKPDSLKPEATGNKHCKCNNFFGGGEIRQISLCSKSNIF